MALQGEHQRVLAGLSAALHNFGSLPLAGGALAQAWMPVVAKDGASRVLQTKGLPYCLIGPGDMLALFRCLSCKYSFSADLREDLQLLGAPGRVFVSGEAETSDNVQQCNTSVYLRVKDAQACRVSSTVLMPVFAQPARTAAVAVLEITQFHSSGASYQNVFEWAKANLEGAGLYAPRQLETRTFEMQSHAMSIRFFSSRDSALGSMFHATRHALQPADLRRLSAAAAGGAPPPRPPPEAAAREGSSSQRRQAVASSEALSGDGCQHSAAAAMDAEASQPEPGRVPEGAGEAGFAGAASASSAPPEEGCEGGGSPGQGRGLLSREDLERHFGYGLKEAARLLGVCNTTLKRACRRHGIMKWPRRELLKSARLKQEAERRAAAASHQPLALGSGGSMAADLARSGGGAQEGGLHARWPFQEGAAPVARGYASAAALDSLGSASEREAQTQLRKVLSGTYLPAAVPPQQQLQQQQQQQQQQFTAASSGAHTAVSLAEEGEKLPSLERWNTLAAAAPPPVLPAAAEASSQQLSERQASGAGPAAKRRGGGGGSLSFVDQMFTDAEGLDLSSVLNDWEQHLASMSAKPDEAAAAAGESDNQMRQSPGRLASWEHESGTRAWPF